MPGFNIEGIGGIDAYAPYNTIETLRSHRWIISQLGPKGKQWDRDDLLIAKEVGLPKFRPEKIEIMGGTKVYKYVKNVKWEDVNVTMYDNIHISEYLMKWHDEVYTPEDGLKIHDNYKGVQIFEQLDGNGDLMVKATLYGAWPVHIDFGKLSYTDTTIKVVEFSLSYDWAIIEKVSEFGDVG